ncbi:galactose mutarotase [bacterium]|nr:MAG: galactose mutarotase [bacterium]
MSKESFGTAPDGTPVYLYTLTNSHGMEAKIITFGGIVVSLKVPDRNGKLDDVVLGFDSVSSYVTNHSYFGALVGRYGNRIAKGKFTLDGKDYALATNDGSNHLHGGKFGFDQKVWEADEEESEPGKSLVLKYVSKDEEEGYPGTLSVKVRYAVTDSNELTVGYSAVTDKPTIVNLTQHSYFNLAGQGNGDILGHELTIVADRFTPVDSTLIPTGELRPVEGKPMDFRIPVAIGARINQKDEQLVRGGGYDHNWVLNRKDSALSLAASLHDPTTGRVMDVWTTEPGLQFYTGNFLNGTAIGKGGKAYNYRYGLCLETQHFPDSPNKPQFPSTVLRPGDHYSTITVFRFLTR